MDRHTSKKKEWFALDRKRDRQTDALPENLVIFSLPHAVVRQNLSESGVLLSFLSDLSSDLLKTTNNVVKIVIVFSE